MTSYRFFRLIWFLVYYDGAVKAALARLYEQGIVKGAKPDQDRDEIEARARYNAAKLPSPADPAFANEKQVPLEAINLAIEGDTLVSFAKVG